MSELNIHQRLNKVMQAVAYIKKDRAVTGGGQNYKAVSHDMVIAHCRKEIVTNGILIVPRQLHGELLIKRDVTIDQKMHLYAAKYEIDFVNIDKPDDKVTIPVESHAADNGDKAPGKAITYATKTAILKILSLETGEDEESRTAEPEVADLTEAFSSLRNANNMKSLADTFTMLWNSYEGKAERAALTTVKDECKKTLMENKND